MKRRVIPRRATWLLLITIALLQPIVAAPPAFAGHQVRWGIGQDCNDNRNGEAEVQDRITFTVCVTIGGQPLPGHQMQADFFLPNGEQRNRRFTTDQQGIFRFTAVPTMPGTLQIRLCDDDGCLYGEAIIVVNERGPPPSQDEPPSPEQFEWEFFDFLTGEIGTTFAFARDQELILASQDVDVRELLPLTFRVLVNADVVFEQTIADPASQCRGPTGCSTTMPGLPDPGPTARVEIIAESQGQVVDTCLVREGSPEEPPVTQTRPPVTSERPPTTTVTQEQQHPTCWWCWGLKLLLLLSLICVLVIHVIRMQWWSWWLLWFIVILVWIPFAVAWLHFFPPGWWWLVVLAWAPLYLGVAWWWGRRQPWWKPWMWPLAIGLAAFVVVGTIVFDPVWGFLLPALWLPWLAFYVWVRGRHQAWWRPWMLWGFLAYAGLVFAWIIWLTPVWGWLIPWLAMLVLWWWMGRAGQISWEYWGPKLCFLLPWLWFPLFVFANLFWDPWWCYVFIAFFVITQLCVIMHWVRRLAWWSWWLLWLVLIFMWIPFLFAILLFQPVWWWIPLLGWIPVILGVGWYWGRRQPWWLPWMWPAALLWCGVIVVGLFVFAPKWWFLVPVFWAPWVAFYVWARAMRAPWWRPWLLWAFLGWFGWVVVWFWLLTAWWWWVMPVAAFAIFVAWMRWTKEWTYAIVGPKACFLVPWIWLPPLGFAIWWLCGGYFWYGYGL